MGEDVTFPSNGSSAQGYLSLPAGGSGPGVVVIQEWWGLVPHIRDLADRFAAEGYVALAPDLYHGETTREPDEAGKLMMSLQMDRAAKDIAGAASYLAGRQETTGSGVGVVGFCMGGSLALWAATVSDDVSTAVGFYPAPFRGWDEIGSDWSKYAGKQAQIHTSEGDGGTQAEHIRAAVQGIEKGGGTVTAFDYPGTEHAFFNDTRPEVHHREASRQAWERTLAFLGSRLRPGG